MLRLDRLTRMWPTTRLVSDSCFSATSALAQRGLKVGSQMPKTTTLLMCPTDCLLHRPPPLNTHPETSSRAAAIASAVRAATAEQLRDGRVAWVENVRNPLSLSEPVLRLVHTDRHITALARAFEALRLFPKEMGPPSASAPTFGTSGTEVDRREAFYFDTDTPAALGTEEAVLAAVSTAIDAVNSVLAGDCINAFCIARPPGHHAEADRAMGFCFLNNAALAAIHALESREFAFSPHNYARGSIIA